MNDDDGYLDELILPKTDTMSPRATLSPREYTLADLGKMSVDLLGSLIEEARQSPSAFKPNELIAIIKEGLDRGYGKAAQMMTIESKATVTHAHVMAIDPVDAYRLLIEGKQNISGLPIIDITPEVGGRIPRNTGVGVGNAKDPTQNTHGSGVF
jgi:hypothetical protein